MKLKSQEVEIIPQPPKDASYDELSRWALDMHQVFEKFTRNVRMDLENIYKELK